MRILIVARPDLPEAVELVRAILKAFPKGEVLLERQTAAKLGRRGIEIGSAKVDAIVTIGGDGTVLATHQRAPYIPILGINMGGTGFLADVPPDKTLEAVRRLLAGRLPIRERVRLTAVVDGKRLPDALNEVVVRAASPGRTLTFNVFVDGELAMSAKGDGVIVSTPTGSTAYALAAGGPIIDPRLEAIAVVPICTSRPRASPLVVPMNSRVRIELPERGKDALVIVDGQFTSEISASSGLELGRSEGSAKFFAWANEFYRKVREKL
ncbi:MAG: NAD(+)/NADH kinase [Hadesarchaea archaeon]|nr:NAD(+)/NADH kinase [Hadesarchaea archaeon]